VIAHLAAADIAQDLDAVLAKERRSAVVHERRGGEAQASDGSTSRFGRSEA